MSDSTPLPNDSPLDANADLETVLAAWHGATVRLERTHAALRDEVRHLTAELEAKNRELARKNRLADLGKMAVHVAHEVRNHLVPVTLYLSLLRRRVSDDSGAVDVVDKVAAGFTALEAAVDDLLHFSSEREPQVRPFALMELVDDVIASLAPQLSAQAIETVVDVPPRLVITADRDMLRRAVLNLTLNALDAMPEGGSLVVTSAETPWGVELEVADSGPGLSDDAKNRAFEPFYAAKYGNTGLGLAIVDRIAQAHGGDATAVNCAEGGAAFTIRLPQDAVELEAAA